MKSVTIKVWEYVALQMSDETFKDPIQFHSYMDKYLKDCEMESASYEIFEVEHLDG